MTYIKPKGSAKNIYVVITHVMQLKNGTEEVVEKCEFVDQIKNRHRNTASVILDFLKQSVVKDRNNVYEYWTYYHYVAQNYPNQVKELELEYADQLNK